MRPPHVPTETNRAVPSPPKAKAEVQAETKAPAPHQEQPPPIDGEELMISGTDSQPSDARPAQKGRDEPVPERKKRRVVADLPKRRTIRPSVPPPTTLPREDLKIGVHASSTPRAVATSTGPPAWPSTGRRCSSPSSTPKSSRSTPATGTLLGSFAPPEQSPSALTWGDSTFWMSGMSGTNTITRFKVDGERATITGSIPLPSRASSTTRVSAPGQGNSGMAWDGQHLWVAGGMKVYALDPDSGKPQPDLTMTFLDPVAGLAWDGRHLWLAHNAEFGMGFGGIRRSPTSVPCASMRSDLTLKIVSPEARNPTLLYKVEVGAISAMTWGDGALWVVGQSGALTRMPKIYRLDVSGKEPAVELDAETNP